MTLRELIETLQALEVPDSTPVMMPDYLDVTTVSVANGEPGALPAVIISDASEDESEDV